VRETEQTHRVITDSTDGRLRDLSASLDIFETQTWQMSFGERAAIEGLLTQVRPELAIELGTAQGGSLGRVASHSREVHTFDLIDPPLNRASFDNVHFHVGDSHELLPVLLAGLSAAGRNVDFVLVDGDHSSEGVKADMTDLLESAAVGRAVIVMHDTLNENVREGLEEVPYEAYPKVAHVDLDFVAGYMFREEALQHELWGGLGLVLVDAARKAYFSPRVRQERYYPAYPIFREMRDKLVSRERAGGMHS
jgi:Methyltransferase domain